MKPKVLFFAVALNITICLLHISSNAQDIHFSQFNMTPLVLNPALAGVFEGDQRAFLNYKNQWQGMGMPGATYSTGLFSFDTHFFKKKWSKGYIGAAINAFKDVAGDLKMGTTQLNFSFSGIVFLNEQQLISGGLQGGYVQKSISAAAMQYENQYNPGTGTYDPSMLSGDIGAVPPATYGDFSTGISWSYNKDKSTLVASNKIVKINLGLAALNINSPKQNFTANGITDQLYSRYLLSGTASIGIKNTNLLLMPNAMLVKQGPSYEFNSGALLRYSVKEIAVSAGAQWRLKDAVIPVLLIEYSQYAMGISYDVNTSQLNKGTNRKGGIEISLRYLSPNPFHYTASRLYNLK